MKRLALIALSLSLALPHFASAEENQAKKAPPQRHQARPNAGARTFTPRVSGQARVNPGMHGRHNFSAGANGAQFHARGTVVTPHVNPQRHFNPRVTQPNVTTPNVAAQNNAAAAAAAANANRQHNWNNNAGRNRNWNRAGQAAIVARGHSSAWQHWNRERHDRNWYRSHYSRFARFGGGYYYYNAGFWYPAYGYDPYFSSYVYDAPVYGYNDLDPGQVIGNVQSQLQQEGYYRGDLDGLFGPMTRQALLNFQADNGLEPTGEIDEPTLRALGLL